MRVLKLCAQNYCHRVITTVSNRTTHTKKTISLSPFQSVSFHSLFIYLVHFSFVVTCISSEKKYIYFLHFSYRQPLHLWAIIHGIYSRKKKLRNNEIFMENHINFVSMQCNAKTIVFCHFQMIFLVAFFLFHRFGL